MNKDWERIYPILTIANKRNRRYPELINLRF